MANHSFVTEGEKNELLSEEQSQFTESELLLRQLIYADKILLNKIDLLSSEEKDTELAYIKECIESVNPNAIIQPSTYSQAALDFLIEKSDVKINFNQVQDNSGHICKDSSCEKSHHHSQD